MLYRISYDLVNPGRDYPRLARELQLQGAERVLRSDAFLPSNATAREVWSHFSRFVDETDRLVVDEVTANVTWSSGRLLVTDRRMMELVRHAERRAA